jgi:hypothetical protein
MRMMHLEDPLAHQQNITAQVRSSAQEGKGGRSIMEQGILEMEKEQAKANANIRFD